MAPVNKTALECVMEVDHERIKLEAEAERLAAVSDDDGELKLKILIKLNLFFFSENEQVIQKKSTQTYSDRKKEPDVTKHIQACAREREREKKI